MFYKIKDEFSLKTIIYENWCYINLLMCILWFLVSAESITNIIWGAQT